MVFYPKVQQQKKNEGSKELTCIVDALMQKKAKMQENECEREDAGSSAVSNKCECNCHYTHISHFSFSK